MTDEAADWRQEYLKEHRQAKLFAAENEHLRAICGLCAQGTCQYHEVERLRVERTEVVRLLNEQKTGLEDEVKRLRSALENSKEDVEIRNSAAKYWKNEAEELGATEHTSEREVQRLRDEVERFRAALEQIAYRLTGNFEYETPAEQAIRVARQALEAK